MTDDNVITLTTITQGLDLDPDRILREAKGKVDGGVIVLGYEEDGTMYAASSIGSDPELNFLLDKLKHYLMENQRV